MKQGHPADQTQYIGEFLHELKTPLAIVRSHLEAELSNEQIPLEVRKTLVLDVEEIARLNTLINEMKTIIECEGDVKLFEPTSIVSMLVDIIEFLEPLSQEKHQQISLIAAQNVVLDVDARKFKQLCFNLIQNAIKYTPENGRIEIEVSDKQTAIDIAVRDNGIGIPKEMQERIFERFYRIDPKHSEGSGLGLSVCAAVARLHGGKISVKQLPQEGSEFLVTIPREKL